MTGKIAQEARPTAVDVAREEIGDVLALATAQDNTTWLALTLFIAGEMFLLTSVVGPVVNPAARSIIAATGFAVNLVSFLVVLRSDAYTRIYWRRLRSSGRPWFDVEPPRGPRGLHLIIAIHLWFGVSWLALLAWSLLAS